MVVRSLYHNAIKLSQANTQDSSLETFFEEKR
jgi:hypothetical protein